MEKEQQVETLSNSIKQLNDLKIELDKLRQENQVLQADFNKLQVFRFSYYVSKTMHFNLLYFNRIKAKHI